MAKKRSAPPKKPERKKPPSRPDGFIPNLDDVITKLIERVQLLENRADASATDIADIRHSVATLEGLARLAQGVPG